ncbi:MAG TPA: hypothetical protein PLV68_10100 [Ilumatobacteraceae bacterium]|nr:hypothetical protein [Ilumatobacteraceae bacterium]
MRRKTDMWNFEDGGDTAVATAERDELIAVDSAYTDVRLEVLEQQVRTQFVAIATNHEAAVQSVETARAEARADLDREKATLIGLLERVRDECHGTAPAHTVAAPVAATGPDPEALARIDALEDRFTELSRQMAVLLRSQQELANSITFMFERQLHSAGFAESCAPTP